MSYEYEVTTVEGAYEYINGAIDLYKPDEIDEISKRSGEIYKLLIERLLEFRGAGDTNAIENELLAISKAVANVAVNFNDFNNTEE